jgi:phenylacetate-coenzyme A ligase PaaK-like adenylate-forming protein
VVTTVAPPALHDTVRELLSHDAWSRERLLALQQERLRSLLAGAVERSPYYRETLGPDARTRRSQSSQS